MMTASRLAAQLESEKSSPVNTSLFTLSSCEDLLVLVNGSTLKYGHSSSSLDALSSVLINCENFASDIVSKMCFNDAADAVLVVGLKTVCLVLPPPRGHDGFFSLSNEWAVTVLRGVDVQSTIIDAMFPGQFDDHVCALDSAGVLHFWNILNGESTRFMTDIHGARAFCFGSAPCGYVGVFVLTSRYLKSLSPVAPQTRYASRSALTQLRPACNFQFDTSVEDSANAAIRWLDDILPHSSEDKPESPPKCATSYREPKRTDMPLYGRSVHLEENFGLPQHVCVLSSGSLVVLAIATEQGYVNIMLLNNAVFEPMWKGTQIPLMVRHIESIRIVEAKITKSIRLQCRNSELYYCHDHGVAIIDVRWTKNLHKVSDALGLTLLVSSEPTLCRHLVSSSDTLIGEALLIKSNQYSPILLCWFDNGSCCVINADASRFLPNHKYATHWCSSEGPFSLDTHLFLRDAPRTLERPTKNLEVPVVSSSQDYFKLRLMYEAFNDVMIKLQYHAKGFLTVAGVLEAVSAGALEQNIGCHSQVPALRIITDLAKLSLVERNDRQTLHHHRATVLVAISAEMRPALSRSEWKYVGNLKRLATQTALACIRVNAEVRRICGHISELGNADPWLDLSKDELKLAEGLLAQQTKILCDAIEGLVKW
mmetsp:Transcript_10860/g.33511  ORF Transcript_10860/g.33511 Transcript_10860/m.33511 type:complete len:652 (-) Transcript_10860:258-2213(-)